MRYVQISRAWRRIKKENNVRGKLGGTMENTDRVCVDEKKRKKEYKIKLYHLARFTRTNSKMY